MQTLRSIGSGVARWIKDNPWRWLVLLAGAAALLYLLRGCVIERRLLPARIVDEITHQYVRCDEYFPIWPGEPRMPTCDEAIVEEVGLGVVPPDEVNEGVTRAICYIVRTRNLYWGYNVRHELYWYERVSSKVAINKMGAWILFSDQEEEDRERWSKYRCPGDYAIE